LECRCRSLDKQTLDFAHGILYLSCDDVDLETNDLDKYNTTYPELLVGFDKKVELGRALWRRLLSGLVVDT